MMARAVNVGDNVTNNEGNLTFGWGGGGEWKLTEITEEL